jgi:predicted esterase
MTRETNEISGFVHRFIPSAAGEQRTLVLLHGTGGDENDLLPFGERLAPGWALLSPRGRVLEGSMPRFFRRLAPGVFDEEDLRLRAWELAEFLREACREYGLDSRQLTVLGYSNGANVAAAVMLLEPGSIDNAILWRPMVPVRPPEIPDLSETKVLIGGGLRDMIVLPSRTDELTSLLRSGGATVESYWNAGGHELGPRDLDAAAAWLASR